MKPRWNPDVLRGLLLAYALHLVWQAIGAVRLGIAPYQPGQFWAALSILVLCALLAVVFLCPTRSNLQAAFILLAVGAISDLGLNVPTPAQTLTIAAAVGAWLVYRPYRSQPKAA
jgi:hypothetical protein